jgi:hypothetical protein
MTTLTLRLRPVDRARLERLIEALRTRGHREDRDQLILAGLEELLRSSDPDPSAAAARASADDQSPADDPTLANDLTPADNPTGAADPTPADNPTLADNPTVAADPTLADHQTSTRQRTPTREAPSAGHPPRSRHQVVVRVCPSCGTGATGVGRGEASLDAVTLATLLCDADVVDERGHRRATIPPSVRRRVLARDRHRCTTPGCGATLHLEIHHRTPVAAGGSNAPENLITLCGGCHRSLHEIARRRGPLTAIRRHERQEAPKTSIPSAGSAAP